jgi:hypothetical protein
MNPRFDGVKGLQKQFVPRFDGLDVSSIVAVGKYGIDKQD